MTKSPAVRTSAVHQLAVISAAIAVEFRSELYLKTFEFNHLCAHNLVAARRIELGLERADSWPLDDAASYLCMGEMCPKNQKPPICIGGSEKPRAID